MAVALKTSFFKDKFGVEQFTDPNDYKLHAVIYLQVASISQALIFVTRSHGFFFMERPSSLLLGAFVIAQIVATIIAVYGDWGFTNIQPCGWSWAGIAWVWNFVWFPPLDWIKFAMQRVFRPKTIAPLQEGSRSRRSSVVSGSASARYYANRTRSLRALERPRNFGRRLLGFNRKLSMDPHEMRRFSSVQTNQASQVLSGNAPAAQN